VDQTQREFLVDIEQLVEHIFTDLDELRERRNHGPSRRELIDRVFRRVHSVKGSAASAGFDSISRIAHEFENLLEAVRAGQTLLNDSVLDTFEAATDSLAQTLSLAAAGEVPDAEQDALFKRLRAAANGIINEQSIGTKSLLKQIPFEISQSLTEAEKQRLISVIEEGNLIFVVAATFDMENFDEGFSRLKETLTQHGEVISTSPAFNDDSESVNFGFLYASNESTERLKASIVDWDVTFREVCNTQDLPVGETHEAMTAESSLASVSSRANFVHTDLDKLDRLISSTHELFRTTSAALDFASSQTELSTEAREKLQKLHQDIRSSFMDVEDDLINLRMVSMGPTLQRTARAGRAAARLAHKEIDFEIRGAELPLDKLLAETIADPLVHLVRNAVDHGIETAEERAQAGKTKRGTVCIEAVNEGSQSRLRVTDDGRGIDPQRVEAAARRLGIESGSSGLDLERSLRLIFRPGFTTLASASDVSGRGVGLDVVETSVEQVGGELLVSSKPGAGTTFEIRLPVTFGLLSATILVSGNNHYCIPTSQAVRVDSIDELSTTQLRLVSMRELLGQPATDQPAGNGLRHERRVITCQFSHESEGAAENGSKRIGVIVDGVEGIEKVLVRNLGQHAGRWYGVAGATELRDGTIALVLDLGRLLSAQNPDR
jgi:two-component system chemotaxis sensor kinase CheA